MARRGRPTLKTILGVSIGVAALTFVAATAAAALSVYIARLVVTPTKRRPEDVQVLASTGSTITLSSTPDTRLPGTYSFWFTRGTGHAIIGEIVSSSATRVTRKLLSVSTGDLGTATRGYLSGWVYLSPADLGVPYSEESIPTLLGPAPAWLIPAAETSERWVIGVHGRGVRRQECLRAVEVARRCGYTSLLVSYRNDGDAPASGDGRYGLGDTEWNDVSSAIDFAAEHGATEIVLMGWSMGGATVLQAATRAERRYLVRGLILESPVIDWISTLNFQADLMRIPRPVGAVATQLISRPWSGRLTGQAESIDLDRLDFVARADDLAVPILLLHSADDGFVPADASRSLAAARPDIVTYDEFTIARHTKLWNYEPDRWNNDIGSWLSRL
jgi:hypothetical protein